MLPSRYANVAINTDGTVHYRPTDLTFTGTDTVRYTLLDGKNGFDTGLILVTVGPSEDVTPPIFTVSPAGRILLPDPELGPLVEVVWSTNEPTVGEVCYGQSPDLYDAVVSSLSDSLRTQHSITLDDLQPNTDYYFRVISSDSSGNKSESAVQSVHTSDVPIEAPVVEVETEASFYIQGGQKISNIEGGFDGVLDDDDLFGGKVVSLGDLDGDGVTDIAVGAPGDDDGRRTDRGAVWILFLRPDGKVKRHQKISATQGNFAGWLDKQDEFGWAIANLGDVDADGVVDIAVGASRDDDGGYSRGAMWVLFLQSDGTVKRHQKISMRDGNFQGKLPDRAGFGWAAAGIGDLDEDGVPDMAVTSVGGGTPSVWILFLDRNGAAKSHQQIAPATGSFSGLVRPEDHFGSGVAAIGDLDGDLVVDLAVGADRTDDGGKDTGAVWVLFLNRDGTVKGHQKISARHGGFKGIIPVSNNFGQGLSALGDLDGDGVLDLGVGMCRDDEDSGKYDKGTNKGAIWLLFLNQDGTVKGHQKINSIQGGFKGSLSRGGFFGISIALLPDLTGNGLPQLAVGANRENDGGIDRGAVWLLFPEKREIPKPVAMPDTAITGVNKAITIAVTKNDSTGEGGAPLKIVDIGYSKGGKITLNEESVFSIITTVAGNGLEGFSPDGVLATEASLGGPIGLAVDRYGNLFIADRANSLIRKVDQNGRLITAVGNIEEVKSNSTVAREGSAQNAYLHVPFDLTFDETGTMFVADTGAHRLSRVDQIDELATVAGNGLSGFGGDGGLATEAILDSPVGIEVDALGNVYAVDMKNSRIRMIDTSGKIKTIAGNGVRGFSGDGGLATEASLDRPWSIAFDGAGNLYIADTGNNRIRQVDLAGKISTVAGGDLPGFWGDGQLATQAALRAPFGVAADAVGNLYIVDTGNNRIRKVDFSGIISTVAGNGEFAFNGDGGIATEASLYFPTDMAVDNSSTLYIMDYGNRRVRKVTQTKARTLTYTPNPGFTGQDGFLYTVVNAFRQTSQGPVVVFVKINPSAKDALIASVWDIMKLVDPLANLEQALQVPLPSATEFIGNFPNPFNPDTVIRYSIAEDTPVSVVIYAITGQKVVQLVDDYQTSGFYDVVWNGKNGQGRPVSSGIYFARLTTRNQTQMHKLLLLK